MKASETKIKSLFEGDKLYVVPMYQRRYAWSTNDWGQLWRAVERQYLSVSTNAQHPGHFLGSLVIAQRQGFPTEASNFDVIDGQQRLTTLLIFMAALRELTPDGDVTKKRADSYIRNEFETGEFEFKIRPGDDDREHVHAILRGDVDASGGLPLSAYNYFKHRLENLGGDAGVDFSVMMKALTTRLDVVQILTGPGDNAHRIFQTLNSTGKELTAVDLLRNHFFMLLPTSVELAYNSYWRPMQAALAERFPGFLWVDLVTRPRLETVPNKTDRIYAEWQAMLDVVAGDEGAVLDRLQHLKARADTYIKMLTATTGDAVLDRQLERLAAWGTNVHHPLTFAVLELWRIRQADSRRASGALACIESFLVRRMLAGIPTNNLNRVFTTSVGQLASPDYPVSEVDVSVRRILSQPGKYFPSDEALLRDGLASSFYERQRGAQRHSVLRRLEENMAGRYAPDWSYCNFTVEHVLPNKATTWWLEHLAASGEVEPVLAHEELRHTIGNLTLTCENPELGQMSFADKCAVYRDDILKMNDDITRCASWGRTEILDRGKALLERAAKIWIAPMPAEDLDVHALASEVLTILEGLELGRWIDQDSLSEYLDANATLIARALEILAGNPLSNLILTESGGLRPDQQSSGRREKAISTLMESGVIETADDLPAPVGMRISVTELVSAAGE